MDVDRALVFVHKLDNLSTRRRTMKRLDILAAVLVAVGGINWGLVAVAKFDLVATIVGLDFGQTNAASRIVYGLVGVSALYQVVQQQAIRRRWSRDPRVATA
jgi:uncharacterized protein